MSFLNPEIVSLGSDPISADAPAGESLRYDAEFEKLSAEIAKTESVTANVIDWATVVQLSTTLLKTRSKDYRVASYLVFGLLNSKGAEGLLNGLRMYEALIKNYWETGFPEKSRMKGRLGTLEWLNDRLAAFLTRRETRQANDDLILELEKATQDFVSAVAGFSENQAPAYAELLEYASSRAREIRSRLATAEMAKEEQARRAEALASGQVCDAAGAEKVIDDCREKLARVAEFLYGADAADPLSYRLRRSMTWGWQVSPPTHQNGTTFIPPVPFDVLQRCDSLAGRGEWAAIVDETESNFLERVFAFDLQRHCALALGQLGERYASARQAVLTELAGFVHRIPEVLDLKFNDDTPLADPRTRSWIETEVLPGDPSKSKAGQRRDIAGGEDNQELDKVYTEALGLAGNGKLQEAVTLFKKGIAKASRQRQRFLWRLRLAKVCMQSGKPQLAQPQLESLDEEVGRFALEEWEPELSLEVIHQLFLCRQKLAAAMQEKSPDVERQLQALYQRLCKLDVNVALEVEL